MFESENTTQPLHFLLSEIVPCRHLPPSARCIPFALRPSPLASRPLPLILHPRAARRPQPFSRPPPPEFPAVLHRPVHFPCRDLDAGRGPGLAGVGAEQFALPGRAGYLARVAA